MLRLLLILLCASPLVAQTDAELAPLFESFAKERAAAEPERVAEADKLAARAQEARKGENFAAAARLIRDARWALPAGPSDLPAGVRVLGYNRLRHSERVNSVHYNRDGTQLITACADRSVRVWDTATGRELLVYRGHTAANTEDDPKTGISGVPLKVPEAIFLPDGKTAASAGGKQIHLWDLATGKTLKTLTGSERLVKAIAASTDGQTLVSGGDDRIVRLWNLESGKETFASLPQASRIESVAYQPNGKFIAAVDAEGFLTIFNPTGANKTPILKIQATDGASVAGHAVRFTPDGVRLFTGGADKTPRLTPVPGADGSVPPNLAASAVKLPPHAADVLAVGVTADGKHFISGGRDKLVRVVDALGQIVRSYSTGAAVTALAVRPDGKQIAAACDDGTVRTFDFLAVDDHRTAQESKEPLWATAVSADGALVAAAGADKTIRIYTLNGKLQATLTGSKGAITALAFCPDGPLVSAGGDKLLRLWDAKAGKQTAEWPGHTAAVLALAVSPDGKTIVSGAADRIVNAWNAATGKVIWTWTARSAVTALAVLPAAQRVLVGSADGGLTVLDISGDNAAPGGFANAHISGVAALALNKDFTRLASVGGDGVPKIWTLPATGNPATLLRLAPALKPAPNLAALTAVVFSPDGAQIAVGGADKIVRIYNAIDGVEVRSLRGCNDWVTALAYPPDGDRLVAVAADGAARIFDVTRIDPLSRGGHSSSARAVAVNRDGSRYASVGDDKTIRFWTPARGDDGLISLPTEKLFSVVFVGNDRLAAGGFGRKLHVFDVAGKKEISSQALGEIFGITPSPDGTTLGVWSRAGDTDTYGLYPTVEGKLEPSTIVEKGRKVSSASFSADLKRVAVGDDGGEVILYDTATKAAVGKPWSFGKQRIVDLGFLPDAETLVVVDAANGVQIATVNDRTIVATAKAPEAGINGLIMGRDRFALLGADGEVRVFDANGQALKTLKLPSPANGAAFGADGRTLVTANADGSLYEIALP